ncbi:hypothetical protein CYMTET_3283 [Cymbomonas tetramitiformis]|uniref:Uncharacterized protein n=1 Tax=Cymbomonas tetramitiformis TaxID=36881 RepID=A0AAE0H3F7_9CHLO|nr:hypothetical protein CYMTET_3283 [Cymbomonas tetramitiformis]
MCEERGRARVLAAVADEQVVPEGLKIPEEAPRYRYYLMCNRMGMFTYRHDAVQVVLVEMLRKVFVPVSVKKDHVCHRNYSPRWRPGITVLNYGGSRWIEAAEDEPGQIGID